MSSSRGLACPQQIFQTDAPKHFTADPVSHAIDDFRAILRRIDMDPERALAEWQIDHIDNGVSHGAGIGVGWLQRRQALQRLSGHTGIRAVVVCGDPGQISRCAGMRKVVGAFGESSRGR